LTDVAEFKYSSTLEVFIKMLVFIGSSGTLFALFNTSAINKNRISFGMRECYHLEC